MAPRRSRGDSSFVVGSMAAAALTAAACMWVYQRRENGKKYRIPFSLLASPCGKELQVAVKAALQAGTNIAEYCHVVGTEAGDSHDLGITTKSKAVDICTKVDVLNEKIITEAIAQNFPSHKIIAEESVGTGSLPPLTENPTWIIDPIDGTSNFASGLPMACVSIGFCIDKRPVMGVVYAPMTDELYLAVKGHGAYRNGLRLSKRRHVDLVDAVIEFEFGYPRSPEAVSQMISTVQRFMEKGCMATRQLGSGVLDLVYVASGRSSAVYSGVAGEGWKPWDYAAGLVIATETGCSIETFQQNPGEEFDLYGDSIICAVSQELVEDCRKVILQHPNKTSKKLSATLPT